MRVRVYKGTVSTLGQRAYFLQGVAVIPLPSFLTSIANPGFPCSLVAKDDEFYVLVTSALVSG
jgi:hypothetical protein